MAEWVPGDHRFPLRDRQLERTDFYWRRASGPEGLNALFVGRDQGEMQGMTPVMERLIERGVGVSVLADSRAKDWLGDGSYFGLKKAQPVSPLRMLVALNPDVGITGFSNNPDSHRALTDGVNFPVMWLQDEPAGIRGQYARKFGAPISWNPNLICAISEYGAQQEKRAAGAENIVVRTPGGPFREGFLNEDRPAIEARTRAALGIGNQGLILYVGVPGKTSEYAEGSIEGLRMVVNGIVETCIDGLLAVRLHPRDKTERRLYDEILEPVADRVVDTSPIKNSHDVAITSKLVISTTSSMGQDPAYRDKDGMLILNKKVQEGTELAFDEVPPEVAGGAIIGVYSQAEMNAGLINLQDASFARRLRQNRSNFQPIPGATDAITDLAIELARRNRLLRASR